MSDSKVHKKYLNSSKDPEEQKFYEYLSVLEEHRNNSEREGNFVEA